jgi:hypothetical protein
MSEGSNQPLGYAPPVSGQRKMLLRTALIGALVVAVVLGWKLAPIAWRNVQLYYWQQQCLAIKQPAGAVVFSTDGVQSPWQKQWAQFSSLFSPPGPKNADVVYCNELQRPDGTRRWVILSLNTVTFADLQTGYYVAETVIEPGSLMRPPQLTLRYRHEMLIASSTSGIRVIAGPASTTNHLQLTVEHHKASLIWDGWLKDDDSVILEPRTTPSAPTSAETPR